MKKLLISVLMLAVSSVSFAQSNYSKVYASFALGSYSEKVKGSALGVSDTEKESVGLTGVNAGYAYGISLKDGTPMFLEVGGELSYKGGSQTEDGTKCKYKFLDMSIPVNFVYCFPISEKFAIAPYAGLNFKFNFVGNCKVGDNDAISYFDKDKVGDYKANRFQIGMNVGVNCVISKHYCFGYRFQPNFMKYQSATGTVNILGTTVDIDSSTNITSHYITLGYIF